MTWQSFVEVVQVITQIVTMLITCFGAWVAYKTLIRTPVQEPEPQEVSVSEEEIQATTKVKVFETTKQTTWLKVTERGLECHLDERRQGKKGGHQWTLTKGQVKAILSNRDFRVYPSYKLHSGLFSVGPRRNWLYSKRLFPEPELLEIELKRLLEKAVT